MMIQAMKDQLGILTLAMKQVGISRQTHYNWMKSDEKYAQAMSEVPEMVVDFAENALFKLMQDKNPAAIIFFLKTKARHRGYIERTDHDIAPQTHTLKIISPNDSIQLGPKPETAPSVPDTKG